MERHPCPSLKTGNSLVSLSALTKPTCGWGSPRGQSCTRGSGAVVVCTQESHRVPTPLQDISSLLCLLKGERGTIPCAVAQKWLLQNPSLGRAGLHSHPPPARRSLKFTRWACSDFPGKTKAFHCSQQGQTNKHERTGHLSSAAEPQAGLKGLAVTTQVPSPSPWLCPVPGVSTKSRAERGSLLTAPGCSVS